MTALDGKVLPMHEKVIHIAFGCGCVRTFHVERQMTSQRCMQHGDAMISFTEEFHPKAEVA